MEQTDVAVIGAGPAGSHTAKLLARSGLQVVLLEKRPIVGVPVRCGEASSPLDSLASVIPVKDHWVESELNGVILYTDKTKIVYPHQKIGTLLDREKLDQDLAQEAVVAGADLRTNHRVSAITEAHHGKRELTIITPEGEYKLAAKMIVAADGVESLCGQWVGLKCRQAASQVCTALEFQIAGPDPHPDFFTFWAHYPGIPKGYVWAFPKHKSGLINIGCGAITPKLGEPNMKTVLEEFKQRFYPDHPIIKIHGGSVPVSGNLLQSSTDHFLLVGDSAHHTDPLTGGGIAVSLEAAALAARWIISAFQIHDWSETFFKNYEQHCWDHFGNRHRNQMRRRDWLFGLTEKDRDLFYKQIQKMCEKNFDKSSVFKSLPVLLPLLYKTRGDLWDIFKKTSQGFTYKK